MGQSGVQITPHRRFAQFLITKPVAVEVDGRAVGEARWGHSQFFATEAGLHTVTASFRYLGKRRTGEATTELNVPADHAVEMEYRSPWILTMRGSLIVR